MIKKLSPDSRDRLNQVLSTWRQWNNPPASTPILIGRLGGHTNESYHVGDLTNEWVVRLNVSKPDGGISRSNEILAIEAANAEGIAPDIAFHNDQTLVLKYLRGDKPTGDDLPAIGNLFSQIHSLHADIKPMDLSQHLGRYYHEAAPDPDISNCFSRFNQLIQPGQATQVLCHQDATLDNLIKCHVESGKPGHPQSGQEDRIFIIDWEYTHLSDPAYDLAVFSYTTGLNEAQKVIFLDNYKREENDLLDRVNYYESYYALIEILWWFNRGQKLDEKISDLNQLLDQALSG